MTQMPSKWQVKWNGKCPIGPVLPEKWSSLKGGPHFPKTEWTEISGNFGWMDRALWSHISILCCCGKFKLKNNSPFYMYSCVLSDMAFELNRSTIDPSPKTMEVQHYPCQWNLELTGAARLPGRKPTSCGPIFFSLFLKWEIQRKSQKPGATIVSSSLSQSRRD